jgi:soluble lytic murein transglycosylase
MTTSKNFSTPLTLVAAYLLTAMTYLTPQLALAGKLADEQRDSRISHAHELLGKYYDKSAVQSGEDAEQVNKMIYRWTKKSLPAAFRSHYQEISQAIIDESLRNGFDPIFVSSVIANESSFDPTKIGGVGEIGLMQLRPETAKWIAKIAGIPWKGKKSLKDPLVNIKLGTAFLSYLQKKFGSHARLYLAAYNMGQGNVKDALERKIWPKEYPLRVMRRYVGYYRQIAEEALN